VGGDPGIETVLLRVREAQDAELPAGFARGPTIVCGSTWPADEAQLLPALRAVLTAMPAARVVLAPHEPRLPRLAGLESALREWGVARLTTVEAGLPTPAAEPRVVLVDSVGRLAGLYRAGALAYVGGAFSTGVHNVAEPAAAGLPVLFGPRHGNSAVAGDLLAEGSAIAVESADALRTQLMGLLNDPQRCAKLGAQARALIEARAGAAQANFDALAALGPQL
jgi:3-deoxy-D-manno-octulosonic-acid transferase